MCYWLGSANHREVPQNRLRKWRATFTFRARDSQRLEAMVDEERLPSGDDLISEIERFLRDQGTEGSQRT